MQSGYNQHFIIDADALIDYCKSNLGMISILSQNVQPVHIGCATFNKVSCLSLKEAEKHNLLIETPDIQTALNAAKKRGPLAYDDRETLLLAKKHRWTCITNDKALRRECEIEGVTCLWGLEPMRMLVEHRLIISSKAIGVARRIQSANPSFITEDIVRKFEEQIKELDRKIQGEE